MMSKIKLGQDKQLNRSLTSNNIEVVERNFSSETNPYPDWFTVVLAEGGD